VPVPPLNDQRIITLGGRQHRTGRAFEGTAASEGACPSFAASTLPTATLRCSRWVQRRAGGGGRGKEAASPLFWPGGGFRAPGFTVDGPAQAAFAPDPLAQIDNAAAVQRSKVRFSGAPQQLLIPVGHFGDTADDKTPLRLGSVALTSPRAAPRKAARLPMSRNRL
jgi:hypothetical protein